MDTSLFVTDAGLTLFGIFSIGFLFGVMFWSLFRTLLARSIFLVLIAFGGLFMSGDADVQSFVKEQLAGVQQAVDGFSEVTDAFPG